MTFLNNKAAVYLEKGDLDECIKQCQKAIDVGRENRADFKLIAEAVSRMASAGRIVLRQSRQQEGRQEASSVAFFMYRGAYPYYPAYSSTFEQRNDAGKSD